MTSSTTPQGSASFVYNGDGLRIRKTEAGVVRNYLFDGVRIYSEHDSNMNDLNRFMIEGDSYHDPLVALRTGGAWYYPVYDSLGSTRRLINAAEATTDTYSYEAFGGTTAQSGGTYNPYKFIGSLGYYSADYTTGLQHLGARYYNPTHGRFTTMDPSTAEINVYAYGNNAPAEFADPSGRINWGKVGKCAKETVCAFGAGVALCGGALTLVSEICVLACILSGPGWGGCAAACVAAGNTGTTVCLATVAGPIAVADFAACMTSDDKCASTPCLDNAKKFLDNLRRSHRRPRPR
jgi:RHS repeat-associated protein